jgi:glycolate oxidase iron-sulfur subunit
MQTDLLPAFRDSTPGREAEAILRSCVHCGFCNATCPTYQLRGDELDGPRGRIYQIKQLLEGSEVGAVTQQHLDRCLSCRACETTCPSGVQYGRLADIGRHLLEVQVRRPLWQRVLRRLLRSVLPYPARFGFLLGLGRIFRPLLPIALRAKVPLRRATGQWPHARHTRHMLALPGCVQAAATPDTNAATARVLDRLGISLITAPASGCCGAASYHLSAHGEGLNFARRNIDAWWPLIEPGEGRGVEALVMTASGCGVMVKDYGHLLADDPHYSDKAGRVSAMTRDIAEVLADEPLDILGVNGGGLPIAYHPPCTLQHGQKLPGVAEEVLQRLGFSLTPIADSHLCCGSAGTYSILQPGMATQLRDNKLAALMASVPQMIVTSNVGCELHLETAAKVPVRHWITLLDRALD